jgi:hypothetical protein
MCEGKSLCRDPPLDPEEPVFKGMCPAAEQPISSRFARKSGQVALLSQTLILGQQEADPEKGPERL